jgi:hypothetical protein
MRTNLKCVVLATALAFAGASARAATNAIYAWRNFVGTPGYRGTADGTNGTAQFFRASGVALDGYGNLYVTDQDMHTLRKVTSAGVVTTLAGSAFQRGTNDGLGGAARFQSPMGVAVDKGGNIYVADFENDLVRMVTSNGTVTTLAGNAWIQDQFHTAVGGYQDGTGTNARFNGPAGVAVDSLTNIYVADFHNCVIRKVTSAGVVTTLAGNPGQAGTNDGSGPNALFDGPIGLAMDAATNLYVLDYSNCVVRKVTSGGVVTTLAGNPGHAGSADGAGANALFNHPMGITVDSATNIYVGDTVNETIRKVTCAGVVTTIGGVPGVMGSQYGIGTNAQFHFPRGVAVDGSGRIFLVDTGNFCVDAGTQVSATNIAASATGLIVSRPTQ